MFKMWYLHISIAIIALILSSLVVLEFVRMRKEFRGKLTTVLVLLSSFLIAQFGSFLLDFIMWSNDKNPIYIYPSLITVSLSFITILLFYYYITKI
ncbi:hypothetical protein [Saccharolobus islandicus]|uniref:Uncharacterized protein n=4 Tax=Saccharolobus islandicus TaxID=43080 RepID=M9U5W2_SACIS|nr:hypothetical protein [Sulfolobus islandicus]ACR40713.1 conserved hypothetical protein [Sulfolobus islandicus M.16.4]ADX81449.1 conserved hypothetical protein [Sulfolobus islandicus HVE10/4]ADX84171.1 conserved hypothetical protein [Sulfolobus islandicus REY15A]AGJ61557.1 Hypothetical Protein SiL_0076 [Sulfolobus islandicus LAL14/1]WCM37163.1 hypothetical protein GO599_06560 [Sulfolobus islandicus]